MAKPKYDGVVEAVHYTPEGQVDWVRVYERRGPTFSDVLILHRPLFIDHLKAGRTFYAGKRLRYLASTFEVSEPVRLLEKNGEPVLVLGDHDSDHDDLRSVPTV